MRFPQQGTMPSPRPREKQTPCKRSCFWTPLGHSTVRDHLSPRHREACHCHEETNS